MTLRRPRTGARARAARFRARGRDALARRFGIDARALAALRVALGALLLADLALRSRDLAAFYTDAGVLPRSALAESFPGVARLSLHAVSGAAWVQVLLFGCAAVAAAALLVGYRTWLAAALSLLLLVSLHARNPLVLNAGDALLRRLLFWGLFLPLGGRWSVDAVRGETASGCVSTLAAAALLVQVLVVYVVNAVVKLRGDSWLRGDAVRYVFSLDQLTVRFGDVMAGYPDLLRLLGHAWLAMVVASVFLVLLTGWPRALFVSLFAGAHVGMLLTLDLGLFPLVSLAALLPFLPGRVWDAAAVRTAALRRRSDRALGLERISRALPTVVGPVLPAGLARRGRQVQPIVVAALLAVLLCWNAWALGYADAPDGVAATVDPAEYRWDMFAPEPRNVDGWYVVPGELESGERVDALRGSPVRWDRPPNLDATYPNQRWLVYLLDVRYRFPDLRPQFAEYLCQRWNGNPGHGDDLVRLTVYYVEEPTRLDGPEETRRVGLIDYTCTTGATDR